MKPRTKYSDSDVIAMKLENDQIAVINKLSITMGMARNTLIRKMLNLVLEDVKAGRNVFDNTHFFDGIDIDNPDGRPPV
jgi:hypothetical protein